jgi:tetratricopeptide (TPR) repeat protein
MTPRSSTPIVRAGTDWLPALPIALLTFVAFVPALNGAFTWDDQDSFLENTAYRGLGWSQLAWMWTTFTMGMYRPLTWMTYGADYVLWGMNPFGYHLVGLLLHSVNAAIVYVLVLALLERASPETRGRDRLGLAVGAGVAALLFALHPLRAEPVAWVSGRADLLAATFLLLTVVAYLRSSETLGGRRWWLVWALVFYALSLAAKPAALGLPLILIVLDIYPLRRIGRTREQWFDETARPVWWEKVPFVALALLAAPIALFAKAGTGAVGSLNLTVSRSLSVAVYGIAFPLWKTLVPLGLSPLYERHPFMNPFEPRFIISGAVVLLLTVVFVWFRRRWPAGLTAWVCYLVLLIPTSGLIPFGPQLAADRYTYVACLVWAILAGGGALRIWQAWRDGRLRSAGASVVAGVAAAIVLSLGVLTWNQTRVWRDTETLWTYVLSRDPTSTIAHTNLGAFLMTTGRPEEAVDHFREVHYSADAQAAWGLLLFKQGKVDEAIERYQQAIRLRPTHLKAHTNLGIALVHRGRLDEAIGVFRRALVLGPDVARAYTNLGIPLARQGRLDEAVEAFRQAVRLEPNLPEAHNNLGYALAQQGKLGEAIDHYRRALELNPGLRDARINLERALRQRGR